MSNYIDLVACKHANNDKVFLFQAPCFSHLVEGDKVIVETRYGNAEAEVIRSYVVGTDDDELIDMFIALSGAKKPIRKVLKKIIYKEYEYKEEES